MNSLILMKTTVALLGGAQLIGHSSPDTLTVLGSGWLSGYIHF
jgi:hypothetical protein